MKWVINRVVAYVFRGIFNFIPIIVVRSEICFEFPIRLKSSLAELIEFIAVIFEMSTTRTSWLSIQLHSNWRIGIFCLKWKFHTRFGRSLDKLLSWKVFLYQIIFVRFEKNDKKIKSYAFGTIVTILVQI